MSVGAKTLLMLYIFEKGPVGIKITEKFFKSCKKCFSPEDLKLEFPKYLWHCIIKMFKMSLLVNYKRQANFRYMTSQLNLNALLTLGIYFKYYMLKFDSFEV